MDDNELVLLTAEGKNGKIELTETLVKITYYKSGIFKIDKSQIECIEDIPRDSINEARITSKGEFRVFIPSESDPMSYDQFIIYFKPEQTQEFEMIAEEIGLQGFWYQDKNKMSHIVSYDDEEQASIDANRAATKGWMPQGTSATDGHLNIGRTLARGLIFGAHRTKGKIVVTYERTPEWLASNNKVASQPSALPSDPQPTSDSLQKMKQLKGMLDAGLISESEYNTKKAELLSRM